MKKLKIIFKEIKNIFYGNPRFFLVTKYRQIVWRLKNHNNYTTYGGNFPLTDVVKVGRCSYGSIMALYYNNNCKLIIGNYVSIANGVKFVLGGEHKLDLPSTFPIHSFSTKGVVNDSFDKGDVVIGDHVWIGVNALILSGVVVGSNSVIAAGSVVVKNVPPWTLIGGVPAKPIRSLKKYDDDEVHSYISILDNAQDFSQ